MIVIGSEFIAARVAAGEFCAKLVFNDAGAIFFNADLQHCDQKAAGVSYEDDYRGNALAAMVALGRIEIRFHSDFSDAQVARIVSHLVRMPGLEMMRDWNVTYQGRAIQVA